MVGGDLSEAERVLKNIEAGCDQFGGEKDKKFGTINFKKNLTQIHHFQMEKQKKILEDKYVAWKGEGEQIDDILILELRI